MKDELPVRVISVPKTLKSPRIIALEPTAMQMAQQSVKDFVVEKLESHPLTKGHVNFCDQSINQRMALESSVTQRFATLDLSAASDRVHKDLVWRMLDVNPKLRDLVFSSRSSTAKLPDGTLVPLNKFASMGSALCFPIEAMFFTVLCVLAQLRHKRVSPSVSSIRRCLRQVYVYGDDIIVPVDKVEATITTIHEFGLKVSMSKSFYKGFFRESCGMDAYKGVDITPIYVRNPIPSSMKQASAIISSIETANQFWKNGYARTAQCIRRYVESVTGTLPVVSRTSSGLGWWAFDTFPCKGRYRFNKRFQRTEVRTLVPTISKKEDIITGYSALFKCLLQKALIPEKGELPWHTRWNALNAKLEQSTDHLNVSSRRGAVTLKRRWIPVY